MTVEPQEVATAIATLIQVRPGLLKIRCKAGNVFTAAAVTKVQ